MPDVVSQSEGPIQIVVTWRAVAAVCLALAFFGVLHLVQSESLSAGPDNSFLTLYSGASLVGSGALYDAEAVGRAANQTLAASEGPRAFLRLPFYALALWPLTMLSYPMAFLVWQALAVWAAAAFVFVWRRPSRTSTLAACALSLPLFFALLRGQDAAFLLLFAALMVREATRGRDIEAGLWLSLCVIKANLFLLVPVALIAQKRFRIMGGLAIGLGGLTLLSFLAGGPSWPERYWAAVSAASFAAAPELMPNLYGLLGVPGAVTIGEVAGGALVVAIVWFSAARWDFATATALALAGGLLTSRHAYLEDALLLLPAGLAVYAGARKAATRVAALVLLAPPTYLLGGRYAMGVLAGAVFVFLVITLVDSFSHQAVAAPKARAQAAGV